MGCWNGTCMISNLHVMAGKEVVVFMLAENERSDSFCYGNAYYDVCPMPFYGKYNDYGAVEECHGIGVNLVVEAIRSDLYEFGQGPNSCHDCEVNKENFDLEKLFEADHEGRLGVNKTYHFDHDDHDRRELEKKHTDKGLTESEAKELDRLANKIKKIDTFRSVTHVIIHGDIFKAITEKWYIDEYVGNGKGTHGYGNNYIRTTFQDIVNDIPAYIEKVKAEDTEIEALPTEKAAFKKIMRSMGSGGNDEWNHPNRVVKRLAWMTGSGSSITHSLIRVSDIIEKYRDAKDYEGLALVVKELMVTSWIESFMSITRKHWAKMTGAGSQSNESDGYILLADATLDILKAERAEYGYDEDEDLDDEEVSEDMPAEAE